MQDYDEGEDFYNSKKGHEDVLFETINKQTEVKVNSKRRH